ncbi:MAG: peptide-methionine (S)-S-oxide reductase MsrA [Woeseiaceae bacterium]
MYTRDKKLTLPAAGEALPGRSATMPVPEQHYVNGKPLEGPFPDGFRKVLFGMGCFWGAERLFWETPGVYTTAAGYAGGSTPNADYREVCSGQTGHAEVVLVVYDPATISFDTLLTIFWENHDPTAGMRQGNDIGTQYRSVIFTFDEDQHASALDSRAAYQERLTAAGFGGITTNILPAPDFYYAEDYHQQYLAKNPGGYCGIAGTGVTCPVGLTSPDHKQFA